MTFRTTVPLLEEISFHLVITDDIESAHKAANITYTPDCAQCGGECHMDAGSHDVWVFIEEECLTHDFIGHELHHAVDNIMSRIGCKADFDNDELGARIAGFLHSWTYSTLDASGLKVSHTENS